MAELITLVFSPGWFQLFVGLFLGSAIPVLYFSFRDEGFNPIESFVYRRRVAEKRIKAYSSIELALNDLQDMYHPANHGAEPLRYPKSRSVSPQFFEPGAQSNLLLQVEKDLAETIHYKMEEMKSIMFKNSMYIGTEMKKVWAREFTALQLIRQFATFSHRDDKVIHAWEKSIEGFHRSFNEAIRMDLRSCGVNIPSVSLIRTYEEVGANKASNLLKELDDDLPPEQVEEDSEEKGSNLKVV